MWIILWGECKCVECHGTIICSSLECGISFILFINNVHGIWWGNCSDSNRGGSEVAHVDKSICLVSTNWLNIMGLHVLDAGDTSMNQVSKLSCPWWADCQTDR